MTNNGGQGSFYTVGYKLAVVIKDSVGKQSLIKSMSDFTQLYFLYNKTVVRYNQKYNEKLPKWNNEILKALKE